MEIIVSGARPTGRLHLGHLHGPVGAPHQAAGAKGIEHTLLVGVQVGPGALRHQLEADPLDTAPAAPVVQHPGHQQRGLVCIDGEAVLDPDVEADGPAGTR